MVLKSIYGFFPFLLSSRNIIWHSKFEESLYKKPLNLGRKYKLLDVSWVKPSCGMFQNWPSRSSFPTPSFHVTTNYSQKELSWFIEGHTAINSTERMITQVSWLLATLYYTKLYCTIQYNKTLLYATLSLPCPTLHYITRLYYTTTDHTATNHITYYTTNILLCYCVLIILHYNIPQCSTVH